MLYFVGSILLKTKPTNENLSGKFHLILFIKCSENLQILSKILDKIANFKPA